MRNSVLLLAAFAGLACGASFGADAEGSFARTLQVAGPVDLDVRGMLGHHDLQAKVGGGGSAIVDVSTGSGSVHIQ